MSKRVKFTVDEKLFFVNRVLRSKTSVKAEAKKIGVSTTTIEDWIRKYETGGVERLKELKTWTRYSEDLKLSAVKAVAEDARSLNEVTKTYSISSRSVLCNWI